MNAPAPQSQPGTTALIGPTDCLRDEIAERIWRAEYRRATGKERVIEWAEVGEPEVIKYLYVAEAILQLPSIATLQARLEELTKALEWQPIETAPKDGSKIDLLYAYPRGRTIDCMWRQGGVDGGGRWIWLKPIWTSQPGLGIDWHLAPESDWEVCSYVNMEPSHWMRTVALPLERSGGAT